MTQDNPRNEICYCGHLQADHLDHYFATGHGACKECNAIKKGWLKCIQYTWAGWVDQNGKPTDNPDWKEVST